MSFRGGWVIHLFFSAGLELGKCWWLVWDLASMKVRWVFKGLGFRTSGNEASPHSWSDTDVLVPSISRFAAQVILNVELA